MKKLQTFFVMVLLGSGFCAFAQVQINKPIELIGGTGERMLTGLELPVLGVDATNKDYVDAAVAAAGGGSDKPQEISNKSGAQMSLKDAVQYCENLVENTNNDWRLPSFDELTYFAGSSGDSDYLWTKTKSEVVIATNQNYISARLSDGNWSDGGVQFTLAPTNQTLTSSATGWATILTITPNSGDLFLLSDFTLKGRSTSNGSAIEHRYVFTRADGSTITYGPYSTTSITSTGVIYLDFAAKGMEEAWRLGPIQQIVVQQNRPTGASGIIWVDLDAAHEITLTQADSGPGLYTRCVR